MPAGRKLGDYVRLNIDLRFVGTDGIWGQGLRVLINGTEFNVGKMEMVSVTEVTNGNVKEQLI